MSYQVLARKWRPRNFREMVGQEHVLRALINALDHNRLHHAYLFTGTRGVGKTTIARILARCLNCETGVSSEPCGECSSCLEIAEGRSVDLLEVDAASRTKVEDTRELLDNVQYAPTHARFKVYLIDEVHMLSNHSFNALLKTLEEPPPHVKFLLATTDPQKLPATVLSRCLQFNLKNMPPEQIVGHLGKVLDEEMITYEEAALWQLGRAASGSMRDALSLTDQAIAFGSGSVSEDDVRTMLGSVDLNFVYAMIEAVSAGEPADVLKVVAQMNEHGADFYSALDDLLSLLHRLAIAQAVPGAIDNNWGDAEKVAALAATVSAEDTQLFYQIALNGKRDLELAPEPREGFEMLALRMVAFRPVAMIDTTLTPDDLQPAQVQPPAGEVGAGAKKSPAPDAVAAASVVPEAIDAPSDTGNAPSSSQAPPAGNGTVGVATTASAADTGPEGEGVTDGDVDTGADDRRHVAGEVANEGAKESANEGASAIVVDVAAKTAPTAGTAALANDGHPAPNGYTSAASVPQRPATATQARAERPAEEAQHQSDTEGPIAAPVALSDLAAGNWAEVVAQMGLAGIVGNIASHCVVASTTGSTIELVLDRDNASLFNDAQHSALHQALEGYFEVAVDLRVELGVPATETPAMARTRRAAERQQQAVDAIVGDAQLQSIIARFDGALDEASIQPIDSQHRRR